MSTEVEKLERLLARVQHNRTQARATVAAAARLTPVLAAPPAPPAAVTRPANVDPPRMPVVEASPKLASVASVPQRPAPMAAPAVDRRVERAPAADPRAERAQPAPVPAPAETAAAYSAQPQPKAVVLAEPVPADPTAPIARVMSKALPQRAMTFGDLLWRSLALRPR